MEEIIKRILDLEYCVKESPLDVFVIRDQLNQLIEIVADIAGKMANK